MGLSRASGRLHRIEVEGPNRPNLAAYLGDVNDPSPPAPLITSAGIAGIPWWKVGLGAIAAYALWKAVK